ncbi:helix-turn-helix domain-containing protein [Lysinibacillus sp. NPDC047702]|uniref:helix-turn-helix domain-containing protein n=1 Tax=unclassified Lysinibacillus TaxID=2636778 RepID=UPI003D012ADF
MNVLAQRLKTCRENIKKSNPEYTQSFVANKIGVARTTYTAYENGTKMPPIDTLSNIAELFDVSVDFLLGKTDKADSYMIELKTKNIDNDINEYLEFLQNILKNDVKLTFDGEPMSDEAKESLLESMELFIKQTQRINKIQKSKDDE